MKNTKQPAPLQNEQKNYQYTMETGSLSLDDIVGQEEAVNELKKLVDSINYKDLYSVWKLPSPKGMILTGPTGVGKTASVRALAKTLGDSVVLMELRYIDIASRWVDMPIEQMRSFLTAAENYSKTKNVIIFIDELEAMLPERDGQIHETSLKRVDVFLEWMDGGFSALHNITVIGATNHLQAVDQAARRPGRFDKIIQFNELTKENIIKGLYIHFVKRGLAKSQLTEIDLNLNYDIKKGYLSGADLPEIVNRVIEYKVQQHKINLINHYKNIPNLSPDQRNNMFKDIRFFPDPINEQDIYDAVVKYIEHKRKIGYIEKHTSFGFNTTSQEN